MLRAPLRRSYKRYLPKFCGPNDERDLTLYSRKTAGKLFLLYSVAIFFSRHLLFLLLHAKQSKYIGDARTQENLCVQITNHKR